MEDDKPNAAASDLWMQMFSRGAADPYATLVDPDYNEAADEARLWKAFREAGWSETEIEALLEKQRALLANAPVTSPGVAPHVELRYGMLCDAVESAMDHLGLKTHASAARGIEPRMGAFAAKTSVIMTDQSIVTVGAFLFRFCGLVAKAYMRTLRLNAWLWESPAYTSEQGLDLLRSDPHLLSYWISIHFAFAMSGTHFGVRLLPSTKDEVWQVEQVAEAMEVFAIAHEYGHHHHAHGRDMDDDPWRQEYEADQFALRVGAEIDKVRGHHENPYLSSGAGGGILLRALETQRLVEGRLGGQAPSPDTHPPTTERIRRFDSVQVLVPSEFRRLKGFRQAADRVMTLVAEMLDTGLADLSLENIDSAVRLRRQMRGH